MTDAPRISVVTASYNALDALCRTVESVAAQTWPNVQHVIVDGGSSDGTQEFLERLRPGVTWLSEPDEGIADALNKGIALADGDWIIVLQADDTFASIDSLAQAVAHLRGNGLVGFDVLFDKGHGNVERLRSRPFSRYTDLRMLNPHQGLFCHREVFDTIGLFNPSLRLAMDYDHILRAKKAGFGLVAVPEVVSIMPATGVSSQETWNTRHRILSEQAKIHFRNARGLTDKFGYFAFWAAFYPAFFMKWHVARNRHFY